MAAQRCPWWPHNAALGCKIDCIQQSRTGNTEKRGTRYIFRYSSLFRVTESLSKLLREWSTEWELNPRILVLQTSALATSPSVLWAPPHLRGGVQWRQITLLRLRRRPKVRLHCLIAGKDLGRVIV